MKRYLVLEDGCVFEGTAIGSDEFKTGELIFTNAMSGYQEMLTDSVYCGQIIVCTFPMIGNVGINRDDFESMIPMLYGLVVSECCDEGSNFRCDQSLNEFMKQKKIPGIAGVDTRAIVRKIRDEGVMKASFCDDEKQLEAMKAELKQSTLEKCLSARVTTPRPFPIPNRGHKLVLVDFGCKYGVIRELSERDCDVLVVPCTSSIDEIMAFRPEGIVLSSGPGDPADCTEAIEMIRACENTAMLGIGLGAEVMALAAGIKVSKMKSGHHGSSIPVRNHRNNRIEFTSQNHGYEIDKAMPADCELLYSALNDGSVEGFKRNHQIGVCFNPEGAPGNSECSYLFDEFLDLLKERGIKNA